MFNLAIDQIKAYEKKLEQLHELYDRQKELAQEAIEELKRRRARIEIAAEALQEAQQRRTEAKEQKEDKQKEQNVARSSFTRQDEDTQIRQVEVLSVKRTREEQTEKKPIMYKEAPMPCPMRPTGQSEPERQPTCKSPPQPKTKSEGMPKAIQKAPPPKLVEEEESETLPPPPPPEVPHPSEIPKEFEVPQAPRLMTPERKNVHRKPKGRKKVFKRTSKKK